MFQLIPLVVKDSGHTCSMACEIEEENEIACSVGFDIAAVRRTHCIQCCKDIVAVCLLVLIQN